MSSFIDLMQSYVWSEADIKARLHAEIRSEISEMQETEINRALQGAALGVYRLTPQEMQAVQKFKQVTDRVTALGVQARADMKLLNEVLAAEPSYRRLQLPEVLPDVDSNGIINNSLEVNADVAERQEAKAIVDNLGADVLALLELRNPV